MDELAECEVVVEGVNGAEDFCLFFRSGVRRPCLTFADVPVFIPTPLSFCFVFLGVPAVDVFGNCAFFFFFATLPECGAVKVFFAIAFFMLK